jgi:hypothetical protein
MVDALKGVPWERRDSAAARGTTLHDIADQIVRGQEVDVPDSLVPVVESAVRFMEDWHIEPILTETAVGSREHWYAGTLDLVADSNRAPRAIYDWKSGKAIYTGAAWQLNAYGHAEFHGLDGHEHPVSELGIEAAYGVHIRPDGYDVYPLRYGPDIFAEWLTIRAAYDNNVNRGKKDEAGNPLPPVKLDKLPDAALKLDADQLYQRSASYIKKTAGLTPGIYRGASLSQRIWDGQK